MKKHIHLISLLLFMISVSINAQKQTFHLGLGWNLGNQMDAYVNGVANETCWGNGKATQQTFDCLKSMGFSTVRIPVTWLGHIGSAPDYKIEDAWLDRVVQLVGYAETAGLNAVINIHHDGGSSQHWLDVKEAAKDEAVNQKIKDQLHAMWTQIALRFKKKGNFLMFESMNEIHDGKWGYGDNLADGGRQHEIVNEWNQVFVDAVRATGGKNKQRYLGVPGYCTNINLTLKHFRFPKDKAKDRLVLSVHYYDPHLFTLENQWNEWGYQAPQNKGQRTDENHVDSIFQLLKTTYVDKGIPVYIGEFGCTRRADAAQEHYREYYLNYVCRSAARNGLSLIYWDNGSRGAGRECSGIIDHATGAPIGNGAAIVKVMMDGYAEGKKGNSITLQ
jgi:endoglucanase